MNAARAMIGTFRTFSVAAATTLLATGCVGESPPSARPSAASLATPSVPVAGRVVASPSAPAPPSKPDVYYIILDRYASDTTLREQFGFDNTPFLRFLRRKGFRVAPGSRANYPRTSFSLASSLNMEFLDGLAQKANRPGDPSPAYDALWHTRVAEFLKARGYRYIHMGSWWPPTAASPEADLNIRFDPPPASDTIFAGGRYKFREQEYLRRLFQFEELGRIAKMRGPKFVFVHILAPHEPYAFDRYGHFVTLERQQRAGKYRAYVEQLRFVNKKVMRAITTLLAVNRGGPPVVVLQADEGPFPGLTPANSIDQDVRALRRKFGILNAYYLPGVDRSMLYPSISPVNSFRVVFDLYFGADLPLVPDRHFVFERGQLYRFVDVTSKLGA